MIDIVFNKKSFTRTVFIYLTLTIFWTALSILTDEITNKDKGLVTGLGYLILLSASIYYGQKLKRLLLFFYLLMLTIGTFLVASYILGPVVGLSTNSLLIYSLVSSLFVSIVMTVFVNKIIKIEFKSITMILTFLFLLAGYYIIDKLSDNLYLNYNFHPRLTMFNIFQFALLLPLTFGMTVKKPAHNNA